MSAEFPGPTPQIVVSDADSAIRFYREAFGADELVRNRAPDGRVMHCELLMFGGRILVIDDFDEDPTSSPSRLGGSTVRLHLYVSDVDDVYRRTVKAGAVPIAEPFDAFWGDRYAIVCDPFGHYWSIAAVREELSTAELEARGDTWSARYESETE
ncbi:MAG: VOC family protein [Pseudonocardiaceae bacterium]|nr:VOC family protein [Pseudonocardiaceae bacterium]